MLADAGQAIVAHVVIQSIVTHSESRKFPALLAFSLSLRGDLIGKVAG
jgi:hypothetical protein